MIAAIEIVLIAAAGFFAAYLAGLSLLALVARSRPAPAPSSAPRRRFAIVVPAHDEALSIERTVRSLVAIAYPRELFDVIVVADNCTDDTARVAREAGATVMERRDADRRGKGHALRWCFDAILPRTPSYDAVVVIDADSVASANFLAAMDARLSAGAGVVQCSDMAAPQPGSWSAEATRLGFTLYNHVRPLGRSLIGCSAGLRGNGMCFAAATLRDHPWNTYSLNEDLEYGLVLLLGGVPTVFAPEAVVLATMPTTAANAESQRSRWERGRYPVIRRYAAPLLTRAVRTASFAPFDAFVELVTPPFVNFAAGVVFCAILTALLAVTAVPGANAFLALWGIILGLLAIHVFAGLAAAGADASLYRTLFAVPRYAFWKLLLYMKFTRGTRSDEWVRTTRERADAPTGDASADRARRPS